MRRLLIAAAVVAALLAALYVAPSDHYLFLPDRARPVDPLVQIEGEEPADGEADAEPEAGVYMVDIVVRRASLLERLVPAIARGATLVPGHAVNPIGVSERQRRQTSLNQMSRSQEIAVAVALQALGHEVDIEQTGAEVTTVVPDRPAEGVLEIGDVIVAVEGEEIGSPEDLQAAMEEIEPGERVRVAILREDERRTVTVGTVESEDEPRRALFGVIVQQAATFEFPLDVEIDAGDIGGPSAGLAFALGITDELGEDVACDRRVTVTGELALDGSVGAIGGVKQKTIGAEEAGASVFVVPEANAEEARASAGDDLEVLPVRTYREAVEALAC